MSEIAMECKMHRLDHVQNLVVQEQKKEFLRFRSD